MVLLILTFAADLADSGCKCQNRTTRLRLAHNSAVGDIAPTCDSLGGRDVPANMADVFWCCKAIAEPQDAKPTPTMTAVRRNLFVAAGTALIIDSARQWVGNAEPPVSALQVPGHDSDDPVSARKLTGRFKHANIAGLGAFDVDGAVEGHSRLGNSRGDRKGEADARAGNGPARNSEEWHVVSPRSLSGQPNWPGSLSQRLAKIWLIAARANEQVKPVDSLGRLA